MKRTIALLAFALSFTANAQMGVGLRVGDPTGITFKKYTGSNAWEINFGRTGYFSHRGWYDDNFYHWYDKQKFGYTEFRYAGYSYKPPMSLQLRYLWQKDISGADGLQWYFGVGAQFRLQRYRYAYYYKVAGDPNWYFEDYHSITDLDLGADFIVGLEYTFPSAPISVFLDANLFMEIFDYPFYMRGQGGLGARFNF